MKIFVNRLPTHYWASLFVIPNAGADTLDFITLDHDVVAVLPLRHQSDTQSHWAFATVWQWRARI